MNTTINYYNLNAKNFIENTQNADMHLAQEKFLQLLPGSASILDFGCGSGRDTKVIKGALSIPSHTYFIMTT